MKQYAIRHISLLSAFRFGFVIGATALLLPGILAGLGAGLAVAGINEWLAGWSTLGGLLRSNNLVALLNLTTFAALMEQLAGWGWRFSVLVALGVIVLGGLSTALTTVVSASTYNFLAALSGGLVVELEEVGASALSPHLPQTYPLLTGPILYSSQGQRWPLSPTGATLGSAADARIMLPGLSPRHAEIRFENNSYYVLYDLSGGQTWVNDRPVQQANLLKNGFRIRLGPHELIFQHE